MKEEVGAVADMSRVEKIMVHSTNFLKMYRFFIDILFRCGEDKQALVLQEGQLLKGKRSQTHGLL